MQLEIPSVFKYESEITADEAETSYCLIFWIEATHLLDISSTIESDLSAVLYGYRSNNASVQPFSGDVLSSVSSLIHRNSRALKLFIEGILIGDLRLPSCGCDSFSAHHGTMPYLNNGIFNLIHLIYAHVRLLIATKTFTDASLQIHNLYRLSQLLERHATHGLYSSSVICRNCAANAISEYARVAPKGSPQLLLALLRITEAAEPQIDRFIRHRILQPAREVGRALERLPELASVTTTIEIFGRELILSMPLQMICTDCDDPAPADVEWLKDRSQSLLSIFRNHSRLFERRRTAAEISFRVNGFISWLDGALPIRLDDFGWPPQAGCDWPVELLAPPTTQWPHRSEPESEQFSIPATEINPLGDLIACTVSYALCFELLRFYREFYLIPSLAHRASRIILGLKIFEEMYGHRPRQLAELSRKGICAAAIENARSNYRFSYNPRFDLLRALLTRQLPDASDDCSGQQQTEFTWELRRE